MFFFVFVLLTDVYLLLAMCTEWKTTTTTTTDVEHHQYHTAALMKMGLNDAERAVWAI